MNRCTIIDKLEDEYGIKPENLTEREKAIIGLCTNELLENEEQALSLGVVVGRSEQFFCCKDQIEQRCKEQCLGCFQFENND